MKFSRNMFFAAVAVAVVSVGSVSASEGQEKKGQNATSTPLSWNGLKAQRAKKDGFVQAGSIVFVGEVIKEAGYKKVGETAIESGANGILTAGLTNGNRIATGTSMATCAMLTTGGHYFRGNETVQAIAKTVRADSERGQHVWLAVLSQAAGLLAWNYAG